MDSDRRIVLLSLVFSVCVGLFVKLPTSLADTSDKPTDVQRQQRHAVSYVDYETDYGEYGYPRNPGHTSQRNCICPVGYYPLSRRTPPNRRTGYPTQRGGARRGSGYDGRYGSRNGYNPRRRGTNWWFDNRDDYTDEILVYRFYTGGYRTRVPECCYYAGHRVTRRTTRKPVNFFGVTWSKILQYDEPEGTDSLDEDKGFDSSDEQTTSNSDEETTLEVELVETEAHTTIENITKESF